MCWSRVWQTTCTAIRGGGEALVVDSPVYPDELELLPGLLEQAGFAVEGLLATHGDWDHLLGRAAFPQAPLGCGESTAARLRAHPGEAQRGLRAFDEEHYVVRPGPLSLPAPQVLPVPGYCGVGQRELELHPADGHTGDGMAVWDRATGVLVCGDYLSTVEIPMLGAGGSVGGYMATLARLRPLVERAERIVAGHGPVMDRRQALAILEQDVAYLEALAGEGEGAPLPAGRVTAQQRRVHADNVAALAA